MVQERNSMFSIARNGLRKSHSKSILVMAEIFVSNDQITEEEHK